MLIVEFVLENTESRARQLTLSAVLYFDVRPVWLADAVGLHDAADELRFDAATRTLVGTDSKHAWSVPDGWNMRFVHTTSHTHGTSPCNPNQQPGTALPVCWNMHVATALHLARLSVALRCVALPRFGGARTLAAAGDTLVGGADGGACTDFAHTRACAAAEPAGGAGVLLQRVVVPPHGHAVVWLCVSGAIDSEEPMHDVLARAPIEAHAWFGRKERRFRALQRTARIVLPAADAQLALMHEWAKYLSTAPLTPPARTQPL